MLACLTLLQITPVYATAPNTVGDCDSALATYYSFQRKTFYANTRFWVFWVNGTTNVLYATSPDGVSWSSTTSVRASTVYSGWAFSVWFDGTYIHYAYADVSAIYYRRGTPNSDGSITWSATEQTVSDDTNCDYPMITVDSNGYAWIGYTTTDARKVTKNANTDGTWTTTSGFPYTLIASTGYVSVVPLTAGKVYVVYSRAGYTLKGKLWTGSWGDEEATTTTVAGYAQFFSVVAHDDDVHIAFAGPSSTYSFIHVKRTYGVGWGSETTLWSQTSQESSPTLSINMTTGTLYCFRTIGPVQNTVYYKKCVAGTWDTDATLWFTETETISCNDKTSSFYQTQNNGVGLIYTTLTESPNHVRFAFLTEEEAQISWHHVETWNFQLTNETCQWNHVETWTFNLETTVVTITLQTDPTGLQVRLDSGAWFTAPKNYTVDLGSTHSIECENIHTDGGTRYVWLSWNDSGANPHNVAPTVNTTYTASYKTQYYFTVDSVFDSPTGQGWYDSGISTVHSTVTTPSDSHVTSGWTGTGSLSSGGEYGSNDTGTFTILMASTCTWDWEGLAWHLVESWSFSLNSTAEWNFVESWTFSLGSKGWNLVESWNFSLTPPAFIFHGLFDESTGCLQSPSERAVNITAYFSDGSETETFEVNGTYIYFSDSHPLYFLFELGLNDREYWVRQDEEVGIIYIFNQTLTTYTISFLDLAGALADHPFVEAQRYINGTLMTVEKRKVDVENKVVMNLVNGVKYTITLQNGASYTFGDLLMTSQTTIQLTLKGIQFPKETLMTCKYVRIYGFRVFATPNGTITITYQDLLNLTNSVKIEINYKNGTNVYTDTETADSFSHEWASASNSTDYAVVCTINHERYGVYTWKNYYPREGSSSMPWGLDWLGTSLPFNTAYILPALLVLFAGGCFSQINAEVGAFAMVVVAILLAYMGWLPISGATLMTAFALVVLMALVVAKRRVEV